MKVQGIQLEETSNLDTEWAAPSTGSAPAVPCKSRFLSVGSCCFSPVLVLGVRLGISQQVVSSCVVHRLD